MGHRRLIPFLQNRPSIPGLFSCTRFVGLSGYESLYGPTARLFSLLDREEVCSQLSIRLRLGPS